MLEPRLFQDEQSGTKMVMTREEQAATSKKFQDDVTKEEAESGERRMTSVKQMVHRMSTRPRSMPECEQSLNSCNAAALDPMDAKGVGSVIDRAADDSEVSSGIRGAIQLT